jgi:hypothetical protein
MLRKYKLPPREEYLLARGKNSFILIGKAGRPLSICIETSDSEYCQGLSKTDIIVVSAPEGGPIEPAAILIELVRKYGCPLTVLPKNHPGSRRLRYVVSAGDSIRLSCSVQRGTHPEQDILCAAGEFGGVMVSATEEGIELEGPTEEYSVTYLSSHVSLIQEEKPFS